MKNPFRRRVEHRSFVIYGHLIGYGYYEELVNFKSKFKSFTDVLDGLMGEGWKISSVFYNQVPVDQSGQSNHHIIIGERKL